MTKTTKNDSLFTEVEQEMKDELKTEAKAVLRTIITESANRMVRVSKANDEYVRLDELRDRLLKAYHTNDKAAVREAAAEAARFRNSGSGKINKDEEFFEEEHLQSVWGTCNGVISNRDYIDRQTERANHKRATAGRDVRRWGLPDVPLNPSPRRQR